MSAISNQRALTPLRYLLLLAVGTAEPEAEALAEAGGETPPESGAPAGTRRDLLPGS